LAGIAGVDDDLITSPIENFTKRKNSMKSYVKSVVKQPVTPSGGHCLNLDFRTEWNNASEEEKTVEIPSLVCCNDKNCKMK